jgi:hypothetical protein
MTNNYCQTFKQKIKELKRKAQNIEALLSEYVKTVDKKTEKEIERILKEIEEFKQEFKTQATHLIEEFIQRRENKNEKVEIIFDEKDGKFIIDGDLNFSSRTHLDDFPNLIKEITGYFCADNAQTINLPNLKEVGGSFWADNAQTINLPNLEKVGENFWTRKAQAINLPNIKEIGGFFIALNAQTINLPNLEKIGGDIYFNEDNSNLNSLIELAREWRKKGILKGNIKLCDKRGQIIQEF